MGKPSPEYPFNFSIYKWIDGTSANQLEIDDKILERLALQLATFLKELQKIDQVEGPTPGQHNWWRGDHASVYDLGARQQIKALSAVIGCRYISGGKFTSPILLELYPKIELIFNICC